MAVVKALAHTQWSTSLFNALTASPALQFGLGIRPMAMDDFPLPADQLINFRAVPSRQDRLRPAAGRSHEVSF
ncbi:MAG: hypothetical protein DMG13_19115 [Acidobacteria bacterium]|nr:MAG: hypothetical protein DMG13_19115 [Acidobacteriota bacterium]